MTPSDLPRWVVALLGRMIPDRITREGLLGDLEERYGDFVGGSKTKRAAWLTREVAGAVFDYTWERRGRAATPRDDGVGIMEVLVQDVKFAARNLLRRPGFSALVIATLALGIGSNTAIFSVVNGLLFEPLPFDDSDRLVLINQRTADGFTASVSLPNFRDWKERAGSFERFAAILPGSAPLAAADGAQVLEVAWVAGGFFETLGAEPSVGRFFTEAESGVGAEALVVLSHGLWLEAFAGDRAIVGTAVRLRGEPFTVVGVAPPDFPFYPDTRAYMPMGYVAERVAWDDRFTGGGAEVVARLADGITAAVAQAELDFIGAEILAEVGRESGIGNLTPLRQWYLGDTSRQATLLMIAVALVLLVACANVTNLLFVHGEIRRGEIAVRTALGAGRGRVYRQLITESLVFGVLGGVAGAMIGVLGLDVLMSLVGAALPAGFRNRITLDGGVLLFTASISIGTAVLAGLLPARRTSSPDVCDALRDGARTVRTGGRARSALVGVEVALSLVLLVGAGLFIQSLSNLQHVDKGFDGADVVTIRVQVPSVRYDSRELWNGFHADLRDGILALPGVQAVSTSNHFPLSGNSWEMLYRDENTPPDEIGESVLLTMVSPEYFDTYSVDIVEGRGFTSADRWGDDAVALVDETLARNRWPGESAIGKRITFEKVMRDGGEVDVWRTVVGVVHHVRHYELAATSRIEVYTPLAQSAAWGFTSYVSIRASTDLAALVPRARAVLADLDPDVPLYRVRTMEAVIEAELGVQRAMRELFMIFAALTLLLGAVGIYSVVSHTTALRVREMGVRIALGGAPRRMIRLMMRDSLTPVLVGLAVGLVGAIALGRVLSSLLFEVRPVQAEVLVGAAGLLLVVSALSTWLPARRAAWVEPSAALRSD